MVFTLWLSAARSTSVKSALVDALKNITAEMERFRMLKEHDLGLRLEEGKAGGGPYVPTSEPEE